MGKQDLWMKIFYNEWLKEFSQTDKILCVLLPVIGLTVGIHGLLIGDTQRAKKMILLSFVFIIIHNIIWFLLRPPRM